MIKTVVKIGILTVLLAFALTTCATGGANVPLPQTINIETPGPDVPSEIAVFSGKWEGWWPGGMDAVLIVEKITTTRAKVIYAWGDAPSWKITKGFMRYTAVISIEEGKPKIKFDQFIVEMINPKKIEITHTRYNQIATMKKADFQPIVKPDISHLPEKIRAYNGTWKGYFSNGTPITEDIQVISEKKVIVTHSWEDNPSRPNVKAGSWTVETEFNKDGSISVIRGNRLLSIKLNKDGTLYVRLSPTEGEWYVDGDLKKVE